MQNPPYKQKSLTYKPYHRTVDTQNSLNTENTVDTHITQNSSKHTEHGGHAGHTELTKQTELNGPSYIDVTQNSSNTHTNHQTHGIMCNSNLRKLSYQSGCSLLYNNMNTNCN